MAQDELYLAVVITLKNVYYTEALSDFHPGAIYHASRYLYTTDRVVFS